MTFEEFVVQNRWLVIYNQSNIQEDEDTTAAAEEFLKQGLLEKETVTKVVTRFSCNGQMPNEETTTTTWMLTEEGKERAAQAVVENLSVLARNTLKHIVKKGKWGSSFEGPKHMSEVFGTKLKEMQAAYRELSEKSILYQARSGSGYEFSPYGRGIKAIA